MGIRLEKRFWVALTIFALMGQVAWVVENMYLNVFIYKMFHASAEDISLMVSASAVTATVTTVLMGAFSDYIGKRRLMVCGGYILWGVSILAFALVRMDVLTPVAGSTAAAAALGVTLVIVLDCVMTFLGSMANDAAFNAWMTDWGDESNRGKIEGINAMMPLVAILVVFGGFMAFDLNRSTSWVYIFLCIGIAVLLIGALGLFLVQDRPGVEALRGHERFWETVLYSFRLSVLAENKLLYAVIGAFAVFGISINVFMPYLILYYTESLGMANYVLVLAPAIILASVITAFYGKLFDMTGFETSVMPAIGMLMAGYIFLYFGRSTPLVFVGSLLMMTGYLTGMAIFGAMIRNHIPEKKSGQFQGIRMIGQVLIPGMLGPFIGAAVLHDAQVIENDDGTTSFLPDQRIFLAALVVAVILVVILELIFYMMRHGHRILLTESGERVMAGEETWKDYPRPQLVRDNWSNLNDGWKLNDRDIRVPFPPQAVLSGYEGRVGAHMEYTRTFSMAKPTDGTRTILHFGAVDQIAEVYLNGKLLGKHEGGYLPFSFDITEALAGENELRVRVIDTLSHQYPYGKQRRDRGGMWYTPVSGIWQSVWAEQVPERYIRQIKVLPDTQSVRLTVEMSDASSDVEGKVTIRLHNGEAYEQKILSGEAEINLGKIVTKSGAAYEPQTWSPQHPYLYRAVVEVGSDRVETYFALRKIEILPVDGVERVCLNGEPIFMNGVLDQGYYSDGIYLPAEEAEYERDILRMQEMGINMLRKHIKVEPECFYYYCDLHGMLVMQDMVNNGSYSFIRDTVLPTIGSKTKDDTKRRVPQIVKDTFIAHMYETQRHLYNHPCIVAYTIFNEGWGQFESDRIYELAKREDPSRLYDAASGWFVQSKNDFDSHHVYYGNDHPKPVKRPMLLSEFGGYSYLVPEHNYAIYSSYGYGVCKDEEELAERIEARYAELLYPVVKDGACGCVYTQLSDVEDEINGLYTYDRKICKVNPQHMQNIAKKLQELLFD